MNLSSHSIDWYGSYLACGGKMCQSLVAVKTFIFYCRKWFFLLPQVIVVFAWQVQYFKASLNLTQCGHDSATLNLSYVVLRHMPTRRTKQNSLRMTFVPQSKIHHCPIVTSYIPMTCWKAARRYQVSWVGHHSTQLLVYGRYLERKRQFRCLQYVSEFN